MISFLKLEQQMFYNCLKVNIVVCSKMSQFFFKCFLIVLHYLVLATNCLKFLLNETPDSIYPYTVAYVDKINAWWPPGKIAAGMGVPGYASNTDYNHIILAFWTCQNGPLDIVSIWADPIKYFGSDSQFGNTKDEVQKELKEKYNKKEIKIMISAFGATQFPTTAGLDAQQCATKLGDFIIKSNLDGVDVDWEDNPAMEAGTGQEWLIKFTFKLKNILPNHIITHAPQAPYFSPTRYKNGAYNTVHSKVGHLIDFYNVQFYNQGSTKYETYQTLFIKSDGYFPGTSVKEISESGIPLNKIVVGKPVSRADASNSGTVKAQDLGNWGMMAYWDLKWYTGFMFWQYSSDKKGKSIREAALWLKTMCFTFQNCH